MFTHFSNGHTELPNAGLNAPATSLSALGGANIPIFYQTVNGAIFCDVLCISVL